MTRGKKQISIIVLKHIVTSQVSEHAWMHHDLVQHDRYLGQRHAWEKIKPKQISPTHFVRVKKKKKKGCSGLTNLRWAWPPSTRPSVSGGTQWPIAVPGGRTNLKSIARLKTLRETRNKDHATSTGDMLMQLKLWITVTFTYHSRQPSHSKWMVAAAGLHRRYWHRFGFDPLKELH